ncbi:class II aldolase/adducin family protein [Streptomyces subrutilus]|uniref:Aldolase n=1 Tax=Streptomyces subrutilus TaxID=36818 RepID=A0A5P2UTR3_9ACTN|nr:class II aldolase/adducin family protein [Streptomyces subrutilus]QEU82578.1 aldolase [Streptomyces subrutilus]WSJ27942.1 class II aldolase/adducin family protein [Streptomyces subrutilus]GGZ82260.1 class II aldolase [Streptomyces subrutilus]
MSGRRDQAERDRLITTARAIAARSLTHGSTGNVSVRAGAHILVTPTGSSLATVRAEELSVIDADGAHVSGAKPSKEAFLHAAVLRARPDAGAVVHTHSTHAAAVSCLAEVDRHDVLPPLTAYYAMRVASLPMLPYFAPGDSRMAAAVEELARGHAALLLSNHGPVAAARDLDRALEMAEEIEETAKLHLLLRGARTSPLTWVQRGALRPVSH